MDNLENFSHTVTISGVWIFGINYESTLPLVKEYLYMIFTVSKYAEVSDMFDQVYVAVWFLNPKSGNIGFKINHK